MPLIVLGVHGAFVSVYHVRRLRASRAGRAGID